MRRYALGDHYGGGCEVQIAIERQAPNLIVEMANDPPGERATTSRHNELLQPVAGETRDFLERLLGLELLSRKCDRGILYRVA